MYINISKILSSRLKRIWGNVISMCHSVFIAGREMMDSVLIINELLDFARRNKRDLLMVKVDLTLVMIVACGDHFKDIMNRMKFDNR